MKEGDYYLYTGTDNSCFMIKQIIEINGRTVKVKVLYDMDEKHNRIIYIPGLHCLEEEHNRRKLSEDEVMAYLI